MQPDPPRHCVSRFCTLELPHGLREHFVIRLKASAVLLLALLPLCATSTIAQEEYPVPPEALPQEGVPAGTIEGPFDLQSNIYPGTQRKYWVYIPAQYDAEKPACTMIVQDGLNRANGWKLPQILDTLIHNNEVPVTVGIFVTPGEVPALKEEAQPRFNRSFEYDSRGDRYARFLLEELIPEVSKSYSLSSDPNDRLLAGSSSGGICAFNAAWERPDAFRRVLSTVGTFVGLRGGNEFPTLIRKYEPKPLRVFLQDGSEDLNIYAGNWWLANQEMLSSLTWAGYDVKNVWGEGGHNAKHSAAIMPDALRWLWRDYPAPIIAVANEAEIRRTDILLPDSSWQLVSSGHEQAESPASNADGELFFCDPKAGRIYRVGEDKKTRIFKDQSGRLTSLAFGSDGKLYATRDDEKVVRYDVAGNEQIVVSGVKADIVVTMPNGFYLSDKAKPAVLWSTYEGKPVEALTLSEPASGLVPTIDHSFMHITTRNQQSTMHCRIAEDSRLVDRQRYGYLHMPYLENSSGAQGAVCDTEGRLYVATKIGVQVLDQLGRVHLILATPSAAPLTGIAFGGTIQDTLFVTAGENVYARKLKARGVSSAEAPQKPPKPNL